jgi:predicted transcriptional regulator
MKERVSRIIASARSQLIRNTLDGRRCFRHPIAAKPLRGYTLGMKTAISIPDDVFGEAEALAAKTRQSRSQLYSRAVREYVARHSADSVTAALDAVLAQEPSGSEFAIEAGRRTLKRSEW